MEIRLRTFLYSRLFPAFGIPQVGSELPAGLSIPYTSTLRAFPFRLPTSELFRLTAAG